MIIRLKNLRVRTIIGVYDFEKKQERELTFNIEIVTDIYKSGSDNINDTLDYDKIAKIVKDAARSSRLNLIEKLAYDVLAKLEALPGVKHVKLELEKPACIADVESVSVTVESK